METFWNVPNSITLSRLLLVLPLCACIGLSWPWAALAIFLIASASDALDGYFARLLNQSTAIGRQFDPLVDKIIVSAALIFLIPQPDSGVRDWMVVVVVTRELVVQAIRSAIESRGRPFGAQFAGKLKMASQCLAVIAALLATALGKSMPAAWLFPRDAALYAMVALTLWSGAVYLRGASAMLDRAP
jgi:CDP-diacylglycerol--glycerol-3-phosphate 3-phosphatidyltransferase